MLVSSWQETNDVMPTQNVNLTSELEGFVKDQAASGYFNNASEVHRSALAEMARQEDERKLHLARLRQEVQLGLDEADAGKTVAMAGKEDLRDTLDDCYQAALARLEQENAESIA